MHCHCASLSFAAQASALMWPTPLHQHSVRAFERPPRPRSCRPSTVVTSAIFLAVYSWHCSHCGMVPTVVSSSSSLTAPWPPVRATIRVGVSGDRAPPIPRVVGHLRRAKNDGRAESANSVERTFQVRRRKDTKRFLFDRFLFDTIPTRLSAAAGSEGPSWAGSREHGGPGGQAGEAQPGRR